MRKRARLSSKGQLTLPKALRARVQLREGDEVEFVMHEDRRVELVAVTAPVSRLKGMLPVPKKPANFDDRFGDTQASRAVVIGLGIVRLPKRELLAKQKKEIS